jgi:hypothetical protein
MEHTGEYSVLRQLGILAAGLAGYLLDGVTSLTGWARLAVMGFGIAALTGLVFYELYRARKANAQIIRSDDDYLRRMADFLNNDHHVIIVTKRAAWIKQGSAVYHKLKERAKCKRVDLFLSERNTISEHLSSLGANVYYYGDLGIAPNGGFTLLDATNLRKMAIGSWIGGKSDKRKLQFYYSADDPPVGIAYFQYQLLKRFAEKHV